MELTVLNISGKETGKKVKLKKSIFGVEPNDHAIYLDVKQFMANSRQGTHKAKERSDIQGSTRKIKRQKGTGTARAGSIKSPIFRGGGRTFGPRPRDYSFKLNRKLKQLARKSALTYKAKSDAIVVVEDFGFEAPKTKDYVSMLNSLKISDNKSLVVLKEPNKNIYLSSRNLQGSKVLTVSELNTYDIMNATNLVFVESSLDFLQKDDK
jgi:large subunit ribosomal protein L4